MAFPVNTEAADLPEHAGEPRPVRLAALGNAVGAPVIVPIASTLEQRLEAIACYRSQVPVIFRFTDDFRQAVTGFAWAVGDRAGPAERFWPVL